MRWERGEAELDQLLADGALERVDASRSHGELWMAKARRTLHTAREIGDGDPESAYVLAYDAARHACVGLLAHQGLRTTSAGGHYAVEKAVRAQFGEGMRAFGALRRRRNELEYPAYPGESVDHDELAEALDAAVTIIGRAEALLVALDEL